MLDNRKNSSRDEKVDKFLDVVAHYFSKKAPYDATAMATHKLVDRINALDKAVRQSNDTSTKLANALNNLTFWGVIIAGVSVLIALGNLVLEIIKYIQL